MECFVLDPQIATTKYLNGTHFVPSNRTIVHHALAFAIPPGVTTPADDDRRGEEARARTAGHARSRTLEP